MSKTDVIIVGGGISGLSALHFLRHHKAYLNVRLYEADTRLGGTIGTDRIEGYSFDWGPNGFLDREPLTLQMCEELGLNGDLERANENVSNRFILRKGGLCSVPMSPPRFMMSNILSWPGKFRLLFEPIAKSRPEGDESIYDFVKRRIGREAADYLVQPMVSGVYGGMADRLSLASCFPVMREMEDEYGSLFKAMIAKARKAKAEGKKGGGPSGPGGWLTSFNGGLYRLIERFEEFYDQHITTGRPVQSVAKDGDNFVVGFADGETERTRNLILSQPAHLVSKVVADMSPRLSDTLAEIRYAPISVVCLGYDTSQIRTSTDGFGFLVPAKEERGILGSIWTSSIFNQRAPEGKVQFRTMVGGDGDHDSVKLTDDELLSRVKADMADILGISGEPEMVKIYRWTHGIPQFLIGHADRMKTVETELKAIGNLFVTGNAYYGIGLNDCVKQSYRVATSLS